MKKIIGISAALCLLAAVHLSFAADKPLTEDTGQQILKELREIKVLLEKQQRPQAMPQQQPVQQQNVTIKGGGEHTLGKADAPLVMIEYTDYQCPFCKRFYDTTFPEIKKNLIDTGKVHFISRNMPLPFHNYAQKAAQAAICAGEQGKYWDMRDLLFKNQSKLDGESLIGYAAELGLKADKFKACLDDAKIAKEISEEAAYAGTVGITGTPSFVLGRQKGDIIEGRKIVGAQPYAAFEAQVNDLLRSAGK